MMTAIDRHHDPDGYVNFNLFCIRDLHRHAQAPFFIKLDADAALQDDWIDWYSVEWPNS